MQVLGTPVDDGVRGFQHHQHGPGNDGADDHDDQGCNGGQGDAVADGYGKTFPILSAETLRYHDACAGGNTDKQCQQQIQPGPGGAHRRQGQVADILTNNDSLSGVIELLGEVTQKHGDGKL